MTMLTAAECREKAYQKMMEAKSDRVLGKKLEETAEAWLALADQIERADLQAAVQHDQPTSCNVGQWVTVTKDDGIVPSMSVTWRRLETLVTSWGDKKGPVLPNEDNERRRETGFAILAAAFRSAPQAAGQLPNLKDWMQRTAAVVSQ
jgi:hypothetical protein